MNPIEFFLETNQIKTKQKQVYKTAADGRQCPYSLTTPGHFSSLAFPGHLPLDLVHRSQRDIFFFMTFDSEKFCIPVLTFSPSLRHYKLKSQGCFNIQSKSPIFDTSQCQTEKIGEKKESTLVNYYRWYDGRKT